MTLNSKKIFEKRDPNSLKNRKYTRIFSPQEILTNPNRPLWLFSSPNIIDVVFIDFETTGGNPQNSSIIEIGAIKFSHGKEVGRFETLIKPKHPISRIVEKITGINYRMVENSPSFEDIASDFFEFIGDCPLIAHGALGDIAFVSHHYKELMNKELTNYYFCTHLLVSHFLPNVPSKTLSGVAQYFNIPLIQAHKAINDAQLTSEVFWKLTKIFEKHSFNQCIDLLKIQADNETMRKLGPGLNPLAPESLPTTSGLVFLTNSEQEITFLTSSQNIRKTYQKLTSLSPDKEWNKVIVHGDSFKYERTTHYLEALLKENIQLKKISLSVDPRKIQNRYDDFVQIFIPDDLIQHESFQLETLCYEFPGTLSTLEEEDYIPQDHSHESNTFLSSFHNKDEKIPIVKTKKSFVSPQSKKLIHSRKRLQPSIQTEHGSLKEGIGYCFGPFEKPKEIEALIQELIAQLPFYDTNLPIKERFLYLRILISYLNHSLENEITRIKHLFFNLKSFKDVSLWPLYVRCLKVSKKLLNSEHLIPECKNLKSGLAVISNNERKELEVFVVIRGCIQKKIRLPIEQTSKLKSSRFFTRLFHDNYPLIQSNLTPIFFNESVCSSSELFSYWLENKRGEGEWLDFSELEPLYDPDILL